MFKSIQKGVNSILRGGKKSEDLWLFINLGTTVSQFSNNFKPLGVNSGQLPKLPGVDVQAGSPENQTVQKEKKEKLQNKTQS